MKESAKIIVNAIAVRIIVDTLVVKDIFMAFLYGIGTDLKTDRFQPN